MLAEMVFDGGEIAWTIVLGAVLVGLVLVFVVLIWRAVDAYRNELLDGSPELIFFVMAIAFILVCGYLMFKVPSQRADGLAITRDLSSQGFCVDAVSTLRNTATICQDNGSLYEVKVETRDGSWVAVLGSQKQLAGPSTTTLPPVTSPPLRPEDLDTTSHPLR